MLIEYTYLITIISHRDSRSDQFNLRDDDSAKSDIRSQESYKSLLDLVMPGAACDLGTCALIEAIQTNSLITKSYSVAPVWLGR